jgi:hypothetical protein
MAKKKITSGTGSTEERLVSIELEMPLEGEEYQREADLLASECVEILKLQEEKKAFDAATNERIKEICETRDPRAQIVKAMKKKRLVECVESGSIDRNVVTVRNAKTGEVYSERAMTAEERNRMAQGKMPWADPGDVELPEKGKNDVEVEPAAMKNGAAGDHEART